MIHSITRITITLLATTIACGTLVRPGEYRHVSARKGTSGDSQVSDQKIAADTTYQLFFTIKQPEKCVKISFVSAIREDTLKEAITREVNTYYIVERIVDIDRFRTGDKTIFYEFGRNFDTRWNSSHTIVVCTDSLDPLKKLNPGLYRIRFSSFRSPEYGYSVEIHSNIEPVGFGF